VSWTRQEVQQLRRLCARNEFYMKEIAEKLGKNPHTVACYAKKLGLSSKPPGRFAEWNRKHQHLREPVMRYFLTHNFEETRAHFGLSATHMKSIMSAGYMDPKLKHLRKEWRPHTPWTTDDWLFMAQHVGVQPREWIGRKLKRGNTYNSVKDALAKFRGLGKYMNGMPLGWAVPIFGEEVRELLILTKAGPTGGGYYGTKGAFHYQILPWVTAERLIREKRIRILIGKGRHGPGRRRTAPRQVIDEELVAGVRAMATFQRWIFGTQSERAIVRRIRKSLRRR
jgi:hypothetical protein